MAFILTLLRLYMVSNSVEIKIENMNTLLFKKKYNEIEI